MFMERKVVFLDRDEVINEGRHHDSGDERNYIVSYEQVKWIPGSKEAIGKLLENNYFVVVVSNQACVSKLILTRKVASEIMWQMWQEVNASMGGDWKTDKRHPADRLELYFCPHTTEDNCSCRKPKPGLIYHAAHVHNLCLADAWMVGHQITDLKAGWNAGLRKLIKVGIPDSQQTRWKRNRLEGKELPDLAAAADFIINYDLRGK